MDPAGTPSVWAVREQLERLGRATAFSGSDRLLVFLRFVVEETLNGNADTLKEAVIGNAIYGREPPYDPRIDSTVRVEARRLRRKLTAYYAGQGRADPVIITLPTGGYVPVFSQQLAGDLIDLHLTPVQKPESGLFAQGMGAVVAVMPFRALAADQTVHSFAEGLTDELIFAMGRAPGIRIISRSITFQYRHKSYTPATLAEELGVSSVLQGTVRRDNDQLRITVEACNPKGLVVWSDRFDAVSRDHLRLQENIAATILSRIQLDSSKIRAMKVGPGPIAVEAHAKVYRARRLLDLQTTASLGEALKLFQEVVSYVPDSARGHSGIADCYCDMFRLGLMPHGEALMRAKAAVARALEIDDRSSEAYAAQAIIAGWLEGSGPGAKACFEQALNLGSTARASRLYGVLMTITQRHDEAEVLFREAREIEPISSQQDIAESLSYYQAHRFQLLNEDTEAGDVTAAEALVYRALAQVFGGDKEAAGLLVPRISQGVSKLPDLMYAKAELEALLGEPGRARRFLDTPKEGATFFARAVLAAALDEQEAVCNALATALDRRELSTVWMRTDSRFDKLRNTPRFDALLTRLDEMTERGGSTE